MWAEEYADAKMDVDSISTAIFQHYRDWNAQRREQAEKDLAAALKRMEEAKVELLKQYHDEVESIFA